jgi:hypothetical protein
MVLTGDDLRLLPLSMRKANLERLLRGRPQGIFLATFERGDIGPNLFRRACGMGLEGFVSKRFDRAYRAGRCDHWLKVRNQQHPSIGRVKRSFQSVRRPSGDYGTTMTHPSIQALMQQILDRAREYADLTRQHEQVMNRLVQPDCSVEERADLERQWQLIVEKMAGLSD